jgi:hypothetical protein
MSVIKDLVQTYEYTTDRPRQYSGSDPTWTEYKGTSLPERLGGDSDEPVEDPTMQEIEDGREVQASVSSEFAQTIFEEDDSSLIFDDLKSAAQENQNVWIRRTNAQDGTTAESIGGKMGLTLGVGKVRQGDEGHRAFQVMWRGVGVGAGEIIEKEGAGS